MDQDELIRTVLTLVIGGGGVGWLSAFLSRRGQREENSNQRVANEAQNRLNEAVEDREQLTAERAENARLRTELRNLEDRKLAQRRELVEEMRVQRVEMQAAFDQSLRELRAVTLGQVRHVANGGAPGDAAGAPTLDDDDDLGV